MITLTYRLQPAQLASYQFAVRDRVKSMPGVWWLSLPSQMIGLFGALTAITVLFTWAFPRLGFGELHELSALAGFWLGALLSIAAQWLHYLSMRRRLVRPDGPTLSGHELTVSESGVVASSGRAQAQYRWPLFEGLTERADILVLWYEPGAGIVVPRSAFADAAAERAFCVFVQRRIAEAGRGAVPVAVPNA
jgi:hypothetical protein